LFDIKTQADFDLARSPFCPYNSRRMARRIPVPDVVLHLALWLGAIAFVIAFGMGFVVRAEDLSPWPWWIGSFACWIPFALVMRLDSSGWIELVNTEKLEHRILRSWRPPVPAGVFLALSLLVTVLSGALSFLEDWFPARHALIVERVGRLVTARGGAAAAALAIIGLLLWIPAVLKEMRSSAGQRPR
jgi:hypothetical protein